MFFACRADEKVLLDTLTTAGALVTHARQLTHSVRGTEKASITSENCDPLHLEHTPDTTPNRIDHFRNSSCCGFQTQIGIGRSESGGRTRR